MENTNIKRRTIISLLFGSFGVLIVGFFDYLTGWQMSFSIFYLVPILIASWHGSWVTGVALSIASMFVDLTSDFLKGVDYAYPWVPYWNAIICFAFFSALAAMLYKIKVEFRTDNHPAGTDALTEASSSRVFYETAETELMRSRQYDRPFTLAYIDLDHFNRVNDTGGHHIGDELLRSVERLVRQHIRGSDLMAWHGGHALVVLFVETDFNRAKVTVGNLHRDLAEKARDTESPITFRIGAVTYKGPLSKSIQEMITMANRLIHEAKKQDGNQIMFCSFETVAHNHDKANEAAPLSRQSLEFETTPLRSALDTPMRTREEERKRRAYRVERYEED